MSDPSRNQSSPPLAPKPMSALPSYLVNGESPKTSTKKRERDNLTSSIQSTYGRKAILPEGESEHDVHSLGEHKDGPITPPSTTSRPQSPYTANPPIDFDGLSWPCIGTRERLESTPEQAQARLEKLAGAVQTIFECIGEDPDREGLRETPMRYAKALMYFTKGYEENVRDLVNGAVFHEDHDELVIVKDIEVFSLCEHHMVPFMGKMHIGYIPDRRVLGLSKLARLAEMFSRRLQVQERLTKQVALAIAEVLKPQGVAVVMESSHLCMVMRGVQKTSSTTTTSCMLGCMRSSAKTREEFLSLLNRRASEDMDIDVDVDTATLPVSQTSASVGSFNTLPLAALASFGNTTSTSSSYSASTSILPNPNLQSLASGFLNEATRQLSQPDFSSFHEASECEEDDLLPPTRPGSSQSRADDQYFPKFEDAATRTARQGRTIFTSPPIQASKTPTLVDQEDNFEENGESEIPDSPTLKQRKPRPKPIIGNNDSNVQSTAHISTPITPTTATGFSGLTLNGDAHDMSHDMSDEIKHVPENMSLLMKRFLESQLGTNAKQQKGLGTNDSGSVTTAADHTNRLIKSASPGSSSSRPSKRSKTEAGSSQLMRDTLSAPTVFPPHIDVASGTVPAAVHNSLKRTYSQTYAPLTDLSYRRTNNPNFSVFTHGILRSPDLVFHFASILPVRDFISLYAISKVFHKAVNQRFTTMILSIAYRKAPESALVFPFRAYSQLSIPDPRYKSSHSDVIPHPNPAKAAQGVIRRVPSLKWLQMILYREKVVHELLVLMAEDGVPLPPRTGLALKKLWFAMDLPDTARRIGYFHNPAVMTNLDIFFGIMFIVKLDQRLTDPLADNFYDGLRRLCLGQRSLSYTWKVLKGLKCKNEFDVLKEWVKYKYFPSNPADRLKPIFGIPPHRVGRGCLVNWGNPILTKDGRWVTPNAVRQNVLMRPDQLLQREAVRRKLRMKRYTLRMLLWGYNDSTRLLDDDEDVIENGSRGDEAFSSSSASISFDPPPRFLPRRIPALADDYSDTEEAGAPEIPQSPTLRDPLLDLGPIKHKSRFVTDRNPTTTGTTADTNRKQRAEQKAQEETFLSQIIHLSETFSCPPSFLSTRSHPQKGKNPYNPSASTSTSYLKDDTYLDPARDWTIDVAPSPSPSSSTSSSNPDLPNLSAPFDLPWADIEEDDGSGSGFWFAVSGIGSSGGGGGDSGSGHGDGEGDAEVMEWE